MKENPSPNDWKGKVWFLMPEFTTGDKKFLDGNCSSISTINVKDMTGLNDIRIPYEDYYLMTQVDLERIGTFLNARPKDSPDYTDDSDLLRSLKNTIIQHKLFTNSGNPKLNNYLVDKVFEDQNKTKSEIKSIKTKISNIFKNEQEENIRIQKGFYDFREKALNENDGNNNNRRQYDKLLKPINFADYDKVHQITSGFEEKIAKNISSFIKKNGFWPKKLLSIITFKMEDDYNKIKKNKKFWWNTASISPPETHVTILLLNPTGENYRKFEKPPISS